jgi:hypothetical protein
MADAIPAGGNGVDREKAEQNAKRLLEEGETTDATAKPEDLQWLTEKLQAQDIKHKDAYAKQELDLRRNYARGLLIILAFQVIVADVVFCVFAEVGKHWNLSDGVIQIWLAAVVVQVIGVVAVVTRHLFPNRDGGTSKP